MFIQTLIKLKAIELVYSSVSVLEINDSPFEENKKSIIEFIEKNAKYYLGNENKKEMIALTDEIMKTGIKLKDASHTACAIISECDYLISTDKKLLKYHDTRIKLVNPIEFVEIWRREL